MSKQPIGAIDGYKLCNVIEDEIESLSGLKDEYSRGARNYNAALLKEIQSGRFDLPSDQGETTRLREALTQISSYQRDQYESPLNAYDNCKQIAREALSSPHREERKPIEMTHNDRFQLSCLVKEYGAETIIGLIPGITEER